MVADAVFAFMRATTDSLRLRPIRHQEFPENLRRAVEIVEVEEERDYDHPGVDVFICTADPYKEPPMGVVNTALSVLGYEYPAEKLTVYLSDDGGSELTLFASMEAANFARHWLPFCRDSGVVDRCPDVYFGSRSTHTSREADSIKMMYEAMRVKVERGSVPPEYIMNEHKRDAFNKWTAESTREDHSAVIQVLLKSGKDKDVKGHRMPNLVYVSRERKAGSQHTTFKAGALNALIRVSATMSNGAVVMNIDCDTYSNDPKTLLRVLCYISDPDIGPKLAYVQFPQRFHGINKNDIYGCNYEHGTNWGTEIGFRYGSLAEDFNTSYMQQCRGWNAVFCHPKRAALLGGSPFTLKDVLRQNTRWSIGLLEVALSKYSPITYGTRAMGLLFDLAYSHNGFEATCWCLPITTYAYIPQLALLSGVSIFPKTLGSTCMGPWVA